MNGISIALDERAPVAQPRRSWADPCLTALLGTESGESEPGVGGFR